MRMFLANSIHKFQRRSSSCSLAYSLFPLMMMRNGNQLVSHAFPRFFSHKIVRNSRIDYESEFNFNTYRFGKINSINQALELAVPLKEPLKLHKAIRYSLLLDSKRVFPIICIACCELVGGTESTAMPIACAMAMFHAMWLMTDDLPCMDNDDFRLGKPSNHKVFGEDMTILASYSLIGLAFDHIAKSSQLGVSSTNIIRMLSESARLMLGAEGISGGQAADLDSQHKPGIGIEQIESIYLQKTSPAIEACAVAGAIIGGASEEEINRLRKYSKYAGLLVQIKDDLLDYQEDLIAGSATYPTLIGKEKSMELMKKLVRKAKDQLVGFDTKKAAPVKAFTDFTTNFES